MAVLKVLEDCPGDLSYWYRHISKGAWPFSTADHGWPISDCTAEGLKVKKKSDETSSLSNFSAHLNRSFCFFVSHMYFICLVILSFIKAALVLTKLPSEVVGEPVDTKRLYDAVNVIISLQVTQIFSLSCISLYLD